MSRAVRVLYVLDSLEPGGAERSTLEILRHAPGVDPTVLAIYGGESLRPDYEASGIPVVTLRLAGRYAFGRAIAAVRRRIVDDRPDVIHAALFRAGIVARAASRWTGVPLVDSFVNDAYGPARYAALSPVGRAKLRGVQALDRVTAFAVDRFVAITRSVAESNARALGVAEGRIEVIPRGRDPADFAPPEPGRLDDVRRELGVGEGPVILNVARLVPRKGQEDLVRAMPAVLERHSSARLVVCGAGPHAARLESVIDELGLAEAVLLAGHREDVPDLLAIADVFAFPSHWEGQGGALVEALFAGVPIVAADTPVHRETVSPGETGLLFPVGDAGALAGRIVELLDEPGTRAAFGRRGQADARERFDVRRVAERHEALYRRVAEAEER